MSRQAPGEGVSVRPSYRQLRPRRHPKGRVPFPAPLPSRRAPVAQWIEQWFPKPRAQVRFLPGAYFSCKHGICDHPPSARGCPRFLTAPESVVARSPLNAVLSVTITDFCPSCDAPSHTARRAPGNARSGRAVQQHTPLPRPADAASGATGFCSDARTRRRSHQSHDAVEIGTSGIPELSTHDYPSVMAVAM